MMIDDGTEILVLAYLINSNEKIVRNGYDGPIALDGFTRAHPHYAVRVLSEIRRVSHSRIDDSSIFLQPTLVLEVYLRGLYL